MAVEGEAPCARPLALLIRRLPPRGNLFLQALEKPVHHHPRRGAKEPLTDLSHKPADCNHARYVDDDTGVAGRQHDGGFAVRKSRTPLALDNQAVRLFWLLVRDGDGAFE